MNIRKKKKVNTKIPYEPIVDICGNFLKKKKY